MTFHLPSWGTLYAGDCLHTTMTGLLAVSADMGKLLAVVTLHKTCLGSVCFNLDNDMAEA